MRVSGKTCVLIIAFLVLLSVFSIVLIYTIQSKGEQIAVISLSGKELYRIDLQSVTASYTIEVGDGNTVLVEHGRISMCSADCPDKLCVKQGAISSAVFPIVCLPNEVVISIESGDSSSPDVIAR